MFNLRTLDLNLLTVLESIFETRNITSAAERLGMTQSAASHALGRSRDVLRDELFIRASGKLVPTTSMQALYPTVRDALDLIREAVSGKTTFDPARSRGAFRIAIPHVMGPFIGVQLESRVAALAPSIELSFDTRTLPTDLLEDVEEGRTDLAIDWMPASEAAFVNQHLFDDELILIARRDHPRITAAPNEVAVGRERFVTLHLRSSMSTAPAVVRHLFASRGWKAAFHVSEFLEIPMVVACTDLLGIMPRSIVRQLRHIEQLRVLPLPVDVSPVPILMTWHGGRRRDAGHTWLRQLIRQEVRRFLAEASPGEPVAA